MVLISLLLNSILNNFKEPFSSPVAKIFSFILKQFKDIFSGFIIKV